MNWKKTLLICTVILLVGAGATYLIFKTEPTAERQGATKETAMLVDVVRVEKGNFQPNIVATGTVQPAQDVMLSPRIEGEVIRISPAFVPGGRIRKGQVLLQIDPADYQNTLRLRQSALRQAEADLKLEKGRQEVARKDLQILNDTLGNINEALVLRQPQLEVVQAALEAAQANVEQAELALERTTIRAPFDAHILSRNANVGSQVGPGDVLGRLVGINEYWVMTSIPLAQLQWLTFPEGTRRKGSEVKIRSRTAWPKGTHRTGHLYKLVGALEGQTRLAQVLVSVPDPLAYRKNSEDMPPLMIGSFMETSIRGKELEEVIRLNRDYVRNEETVWVMEDSLLRIKEVDIAFQDAEYAYITGGLEASDFVVTTNLTTVVNGAPLRTAAPTTGAQRDSVPSTAQQIPNTTQPSNGIQ